MIFHTCHQRWFSKLKCSIQTVRIFLILVYPTGEVCISILHPPFEDPMNPQEKVEEKWNPILTIEAVIMSITSMLVDPNLDSPANVDAAKLYK